jgi:ribokinase
MIYDVITFGSATRDIFIRSKDLKIINSPEFVTGKALAMGAGAKIYVEEMYFLTGGGGTNTAATFALQGLKTAYCGLVGSDANAREIIKEMKDLGIATDFIKVTDKADTPSSVILSSGTERTILVHEGASHLLSKNDIEWEKIKKSRWFYIAGFSGESVKVYEPLVDFAKENKIKIALNPGHDQLTKDQETLKKTLAKIDILIVNQEEASALTGIEYQKEEELFKKFDELMPGIAVMSKGSEGVAVSDNKKIYRAGIPESGYVDRTGAGDAFGSGFVSAIIQGRDIPYAIQLGTANATSTIQNIGAKTGLLKKGEWGEWEKVKVISN